MGPSEENGAFNCLPPPALDSAPLPEISRESLDAANQHRVEDAILVARRLAHVYSNVLTSVVGFLELGLTQADVNPTLRRYLEIALQGAQQGVSLTQRLRLLGCKATANATGVNLVPLLQRHLGKRAVAGKEVEELLEAPADLPLVSLNNEQLNAVVEALLDNAHEAIEGSGKVLLSVRPITLTAEELKRYWGRPQPGLNVRLDVADTGKGIGADTRSRLFREPFFTVKSRHHGLGLTIVQSILSAQQGGICLLDNPGGGVIARVILPICGERKTLP